MVSDRNGGESSSSAPIQHSFSGRNCQFSRSVMTPPAECWLAWAEGNSSHHLWAFRCAGNAVSTQVPTSRSDACGICRNAAFPPGIPRRPGRCERSGSVPHRFLPVPGSLPGPCVLCPGLSCALLFHPPPASPVQNMAPRLGVPRHRPAPPVLTTLAASERAFSISS